MIGPAIRSYGAADAAAVLALWAAAVDPRYPLRADVWEATIASNPHARPGDVAVADADGRLVGFALAGIVRSSAPELVELRGRAWLQAVVVDPTWRRRGLGTALVCAAAGIGREAGAERIAAGGGLFYLWPGVPDGLDAALPFLRALGFVEEGGVSYDLRGDISTLRLDDASVAALTGAGLVLAPTSRDEAGALLGFVAAEFGGGWSHDLGWFLAAGGDPADLLVLHDDRGGIHGFARIHTAVSRPPGWPMFWRDPVAGAGGLGPIGIASRLRGRGLGRALLVAALDHLRRMGSTDIVIDDTTLLGYYGPHGFAPWIEYRHASASLAPLLAMGAADHGGLL